MFHQTKIFKDGEPRRLDFVHLAPGSTFGVVASSHGDAAALEEALERIASAGAATIFHTGDITGESSDPSGCLSLLESWGCHAVLGNHDVLCLDREFIHEYDSMMLRAAGMTTKACDKETIKKMAGRPVKIESEQIAIVHESVKPPFYAKRSKRRRRTHGWDSGSSAEENSTAVSFGHLRKPNFIGSDHKAYVIHSAPLIQVSTMHPGDTFELPANSVVSVPSIAYSRQEDFDCGYVLGRLSKDGGVSIEFHSFTPSRRSPKFDGL